VSYEAKAPEAAAAAQAAASPESAVAGDGQHKATAVSLHK
jgi:hypothetical protein